MNQTEAPAWPTMREHFEQTHHTVIQVLGTPWYCQDCPVRSPLYGLTVDAAPPVLARQAGP